MNNTLYSQMVHMLAVAALTALVAIGKLDVQTGVSGIALLVGIALPSPFSAVGAASAVPAGPAPTPLPLTPQTPPAQPPAAG